MGRPQPMRRQRHIERVKAHMPLGGLDGSHRVSRKHESLSEEPIREVGVERHGPLELGGRRLMLAPATEGVPERGMCLGQIGVELYGFASSPAGPIKRTSTFLEKSSQDSALCMGLCDLVTKTSAETRHG